jgi:hypothetical protein
VVDFCDSTINQKRKKKMSASARRRKEALLEITLKLIGKIFKSSDMGRRKWDFYEARIVACRSLPDVMTLIEALAKQMKSPPLSPAEIRLIAEYDQATSRSVATWIGRNTKAATSLAWEVSKKKKVDDVTSDDPDAVDDFDLGVDFSNIEIPDAPEVGALPPRGDFDISINLTLTEPLYHGSDEKTGNFQSFRRKSVMTKTGGLAHIPFYAGNALRGQLRDLAANHFSEWLASKDFKPSKWFFHLIFSGGSTNEIPDAPTSEAPAKKAKAADLFGERVNGRSIHDSASAQAVLPILGLFGGTISSTFFPGSFDIFDLEPLPGEYDMNVEYLTKRDDSKQADRAGVESPDDEKTMAMIAATETMVRGSILRGGINIKKHIRTQWAALLRFVLDLLNGVEKHPLGGSSRRGWGYGNWEFKGLESLPDAQEYLDFLESEEKSIIEFLSSVNAIEPLKKGE